MQSTLAPKEADPHDVFAIDPDVVLATRTDTTSAGPARDGGASAPPRPPISGVSAPSVDARFRAAAVDDITLPRRRPAIGKWVRPVLVSFLFALCSAFAAAGWTQYGDRIKATAASWTPNAILTSSQEQPVAEQSGPPVLQADAATEAAAQPAAAPPSAPNAAPTVAALPPETAQLLQSMSQQIEQLKASVEQLKSGQEQISRDMARNAETRTAQARTAEQNPRPKLAAAPLRPAAAPVHRPRPAFAPVQAAAAPALPRTATVAPMPLPPAPPPAQPLAEPDDELVVRPPMPVR